MVKAKKAKEENVSSQENAEELKKKVDSLVDIIEELSSNVDKSGLPEVENLIDAKLKEMNEKFEMKFQDLKNVLDSIEKKSGKSKTKEEISALIDEFKKSIEPRFTTLEERLKLLDRLESIQAPTQEKSEVQKNEFLTTNFTSKTSNYDVEPIKKNLAEINQTLSLLKEQMDLVRNSVKSQGLLDATDIQKFENILNSLHEMIPQKTVVDNFRIAFREINDLKNKMNEYRNDLQRYVEAEKEYYEDISSRLETLVKYLNALIEERDRNFSDLSKVSTDIYTKTLNLEKSMEYLYKSIRELQEQVNRQSEKIKILEDFNKKLAQTSTKEDLKAVNENIKKVIEQNKSELQDIKQMLSSINKSFEQKLSEQIKTSRERFDELERILVDGLRKNNEMVRNLVEEK
ncbi:MAG: hypothetical protein NZ893_02470, partial [Candidatus Aenigmarchaeota archaeon]|nr:hypothetical protein [Candidatus Aenigmarchaeota archaeon]